MVGYRVVLFVQAPTILPEKISEKLDLRISTGLYDLSVRRVIFIQRVFRHLNGKVLQITLPYSWHQSKLLEMK